jgi:hypothetical protein
MPLLISRKNLLSVELRNLIDLFRLRNAYKILVGNLKVSIHLREMGVVQY